MDKVYYILISFFLFATTISSQDISFIEAKNVATCFYNIASSSDHVNEPFSLKFDLSIAAELPKYFVFNVNNNKGFIIVSASKNLPPILGFSFHDSFTKNHDNQAFEFWMQNVTDQFSHTIVYNTFHDEWKKYQKESSIEFDGIKTVGPLLNIAWAQACYYNALCPADPAGPCGNAVTGCGATAMAMILKYWNFPEHGIGSNQYENDPYGLLSADFQNTYYDWDNMPPQLSSQSTDVEIDAVAELMSHAGIAVDMLYTTNSSFSDNWKIRNAFINHFDYTSESQFLDKMDFTNAEWTNLMQNEIDKGIPVSYGISSGTNGHFVVMDGYQDDEYFHFNWGYGNLNGYYRTFAELPIIQQANIGITPNSDKLEGFVEMVAYNGVFNDGSNHNLYPNNKTYQWLICPEDALSVVILFDDFSTEYQSDIVNIYDGETTDSPLLGSFSGHRLPPILESSGNKVLVEFITNDLIVDKGFNLRYTSTRSILACSGISFFTDSIGVFDDGSGIMPYVDNADCFWLIKPDTACSINLQFNDFDTETDWDFLDVYNGENLSPANLQNTLTGNITPPEINSTEGSMLLHFHSDWNTAFQGWEVSFSTDYKRINLHARVFLEGPFLEEGMNPEISDLLPFNQPFDKEDSAIWYYEGNEFVDVIPDLDIVDWLLVELRDTTFAELAFPETKIARQAAFLLSDGSIVGLDGFSNLEFYNSFKYNLFLVVYARNHLPVLSAIPLVESDEMFNYDFTVGENQAFNGGQKEIQSGVWGMFAGDIQPDGKINIDDKLVWEMEVGRTGYLQSDLNYQGQSDNEDKNKLWLQNLGVWSSVPD